MRIFVCYEESWESFDVPAGQTVGAIKKMVKDSFLVCLPDHHLEVRYGGAALQDGWTLGDVGVASGNSIKCCVKSDEKPAMFVFNAVTGETFPATGSASLQNMSVSQLTSAVSAHSGLPVSVFRLSTPAGVHLYDCNTLQDYAIKAGAILRLDAWDGWVEFLRGCLLGHVATVQGQTSKKKLVMRFQLRVALYMAASLGHLALAGWLLEKGVPADQPVGVHPYRQWCQRTAHRDTRRCPVHVAAESNRLLILKLFVAKDIFTLACRDPAGCDPLRIAVQHGHRECARYLAGKLSSVVSLQNMSLPVRIYLQMKRWLRAARQRTASDPWRHTFTCKVLSVDGFTPPKMSSKPKKLEPASDETLPRLGSKMSENPPVLLKEMRINPKQNQKDTDGSAGLRPSLPPLSSPTSPRVRRLFAAPSHHGGSTARENAIHCLTIASTFTAKPWSKQLSIARTLARKQFQSLP
ncbi:protein ANKUB1-like [Nerophis ophidion]|uniref:protein ANKUB1-like n=1 Tax=Nerophis ophidion TaxID=159077 RepID=UPI002ADFD3E7|nr:protein ANKUB1-like [Nerophis ophidion]